MILIMVINSLSIFINWPRVAGACALVYVPDNIGELPLIYAFTHNTLTAHTWCICLVRITLFQLHPIINKISLSWLKLICPLLSSSSSFSSIVSLTQFLLSFNSPLKTPLLPRFGVLLVLCYTQLKKSNPFGSIWNWSNQLTDFHSVGECVCVCVCAWDEIFIGNFVCLFFSTSPL